jgi:hypothetical protein
MSQLCSWGLGSKEQISLSNLVPIGSAETFLLDYSVGHELQNAIKYLVFRVVSFS